MTLKGLRLSAQEDKASLMCALRNLQYGSKIIQYVNRTIIPKRNANVDKKKKSVEQTR